MEDTELQPFALLDSESGRFVSATESADLFGARSTQFSGTWPTSGLMLSGRVYELPTSVLPTSGSGSSSSPGRVPVFDTPDTMPEAPNAGSNRRSQPAGLGNQVRSLLPTPVASPSGNAPEVHLRKKPGRGVVTDLAIVVEHGLLESGGRLMPTPKAADGEFSTPSTSGRPVEKSTHLGTIAMLVSGELEHRRTSGLLPTPDASLGSRGGPQHPEKRREGGHSVGLQDAIHLLPTPSAADGSGGRLNSTGHQQTLPGVTWVMARGRHLPVESDGDPTRRPSDAGKLF